MIDSFFYDTMTASIYIYPKTKTPDRTIYYKFDFKRKTYYIFKTFS